MVAILPAIDATVTEPVTSESEPIYFQILGKYNLWAIENA